MKDPTRLRDQSGLPDALQTALRELGRAAPPAASVARVQRTLSALPTAQGTGLLALSWGKTVIGACAVGLVSAATWLGLPRTEQHPVVVHREPRREPQATALPAHNVEAPFSAAQARVAEVTLATAASAPTPRIVSRAYTSPDTTLNVSRRDHKHSPAVIPTSGTQHSVATTTAEGAPSVAASAVQGGANTAAAAAPTVPEPEPRPRASEAVPAQPNQLQGPAPEDEASLLYRARRLARTDRRAAWRMVEQHAYHFPSGTLVEEREVLAIELLERMGQSQEARRRTARFLSQFPSSSYRSAVEPRAAH